MLLHKNKIIFFKIVAMAFTLASCGQKFFPEFKVDNAIIEDGKVIVEFSAPVRVESIKENFFFNQDDSNVKGELSFDKNRVVFAPSNAIEENHCYEVLIYTGAEDTNGNSLEEEFKKLFYTKDDLSHPQVLQIQNIFNEEEKTTSLKIQFSKKMNGQSFVENFSIEPSASFITKWNDAGDTVELFFEKDLIEKTFYAIKIDVGTKDAFNNFFAKEFTWSFENIPNYITPECSVRVFNCDTENYETITDTAEYVDFSKEIEIQFSKKIDADKIKQNISVEPQISYNVEVPLNDGSNFSNLVKIKFTEMPKWNSTYKLLISENITDGYGNAVQEKSFILKNNSEKLRPPIFEFFVIKIRNTNNVDEYKIISTKDYFCDLLFDSETYKTNFTTNVPIWFVFRISENSQTINEASAMGAINVVPQNSCANIILKNMNICSYNELITQSETGLISAMENAVQDFGLQDAKLVCVKIDSEFTNGETGSQITNGLINFKIVKTLCDDNNIFMEEAVQVSCNKK